MGRERAARDDRCDHSRSAGLPDRGGGDPSISPLAVDSAGIGIDENCSGADAPVTTRARADIAPAGRPPDIVLITIDTLRADPLGFYGYPRASSPELDANARRAVDFEPA